jgi:rsbT co-antagonist protein RsbR
MSRTHVSVLPQLLAEHESKILSNWISEQMDQKSAGAAGGEAALREQSRELLNAFRHAAQAESFEDLQSSYWTGVRETLKDISSSRARQGQSPSEIATFVFSLKQALFGVLQSELSGDPEAFARETWVANLIIDKLGLFTTEVALQNREQAIARQQEEMLELSTPVVKLWEGILALPLIGTLDSARTQIVMESLLEEIVRCEASLAIIDITGVGTVDTLVAQHLLKTVAAARLMGAECIISGIRPQIAATIVHLGVDLGEVTTKATLADAFSLALRRLNLVVTKAPRSGN